ncbi:hypothetical protein FQN51_004575 [Onygenales sp. PD_10]|nr:hypothetical protein FQN51_004575 [Onygenales sp. PD_10]
MSLIIDDDDIQTLLNDQLNPPILDAVLGEDFEDLLDLGGGPVGGDDTEPDDMITLLVKN